MIRFEVPGPPAGKGRPRFVKATGRTYTDGKTVSAEQLIRLAWMENGSPRTQSEGVVFDLELVIARPQGHWRADGSLAPVGQRKPWPTRKPDVDNALKLAMDSLNGLAYDDDVRVLHATVLKRWAVSGEDPHTVITIIPKDHTEAAAA